MKNLSVYRKLLADEETLYFVKSTLRHPCSNIVPLIRLTSSLGKDVFRKAFASKMIGHSCKGMCTSFHKESDHYKIPARAEYLLPLYKSNVGWKYNRINPNWHNLLPTTGWKPLNGAGTSGPGHEILLSGKHFCIGNGDKIDWKRIYADREDTMALNRFGWLIRLLVYDGTLRVTVKGLEWILNWIQHQRNSKNEIAWESYSASERIVNWLLFLCATKPFQNRNNSHFHEIALASFDHLEYLLFNLEFRGKDTNNHILNNARALYIGGRLLGFSFAEEVGAEIIRNETERLLPKGVLNEGSTHYQYIVTKSYLEMYWTAKETKDTNMSAWLKNTIGQLLDTCHFLSIKTKSTSEFPLFGDISPDFPPDWFYGYPFTQKSAENDLQLSPCSKLWGNFKDTGVHLGIDSLYSDSKASEQLIKRHWIRFHRKNITLFSTAKSENIRAHLHQDDGAFCIYYNELPIIIDPGLNSYMWRDPISIYQAGKGSHSTISINGIGLCSSKLSIVQYAFPKRFPTNFSKTSKGFELQMKGFRALGRWVDWRRNFVLDDDKLIIQDIVSSTPGEEVNLRYVLDKNILLDTNNCNNGSFRLSNQNIDIDLSIIAKAPDNTYVYPEDHRITKRFSSKLYGDLDHCYVLDLLYQPKDTISIHSIFHFKTPGQVA